MPARRTLTALVAASGCLIPALVAPATARANTAPWATDTVFVAATGERVGGDGGLFAITPDGTTTALGAGDAQDVAVTADGTLYWVTCSGGVYSYSPTAGPGTVTDGLNCPKAIAVETSGKLLVSDADNLYEMNADGTGLTTVMPGGTFLSMAVDPAGDIFAADADGALEMLVAGTSRFQRIQIDPSAGNYRVVRLAADSSLLVAGDRGMARVVWKGPALTYHGGEPNGATINRNGDLWMSRIRETHFQHGQVSFTPVGTWLHEDLAHGFDHPRGLAVYPAVVPAPRSATTITVTRSPVNAQHQASLFAKVDGGSVGNGLAQFIIDGKPTGALVEVNRVGSARTVVTLPRGAHTIAATFLGSATGYPSESAPLSYSLRALTSTTTLSTGSTTVPQAAPVNVTATVIGQNGVTPTGPVTFSVNGRTQIQADLDGEGRATVSLHLPPGTPRVTARYGGDQVLVGSSAPAMDFTTTAPYTSSIDAEVRYGPVHADGRQGITLAVKVTGVGGQPRPTGAVRVTDAYFSCAELVPTSNIRKSKTTCHAIEPRDHHQAGVLYEGDSTYAGSFTLVNLDAGGGTG